MSDSQARTRIKICGITSRKDALAAIDAGADALGFVFYPPSPRAVDISTVQEIIDGLPAFVSTVGLFLDEQAERVTEVSAALSLDLLQFHGNETGEYCAGFSRPYIKAIGMADQRDLNNVFDTYAGARAFLLDSHAAGQAGGTGKAFNWLDIPDASEATLILAGGLNPGNVADAVKQVRPYAVDVSSGVESSPGKKDVNLMKQFVAQVRSADSELYV